MTRMTEKAFKKALAEAGKKRREAIAAHRRGEISFEERQAACFEYHSEHARLYREIAREN